MHSECAVENPLGVVKRWRGKRLGRSWLLLFVVGIVGCKGNQLFVEGPPDGAAAAPTAVLLLPPDVQLSTMNVSGLEEVRADWSQQAYANLSAALARALNARGIDAVRYAEYSSAFPWKPEHAPFVKMHEAVSEAILSAPILPTQSDKRPNLAYGIGDAARSIRQDYPVRYALMLRSRAAYASGGRNAVRLLAAVGRINLPGARQREFLSLVDLETGEIAWFNALPERGSLISRLDARQAESAAEMVDELLKVWPW